MSYGQLAQREQRTFSVVGRNAVVVVQRINRQETGFGLQLKLPVVVIYRRGEFYIKLSETRSRLAAKTTSLSRLKDFTYKYKASSRGLSTW